MLGVFQVSQSLHFMALIFNVSIDCGMKLRLNIFIQWKMNSKFLHKNRIYLSLLTH